MVANDCEHCNLDRVVWHDVIPCTYQSFAGVWYDLVYEQNTDFIRVFVRDDRILYVIGVLLAAFTIQILTVR